MYKEFIFRISDSILKTRKYLNEYKLIKYNSFLKINQALQGDGSIGQMTNNNQVKTWCKLNVHLNCFHWDYPIKSTPLWTLKPKVVCPMTMKKASSDFKYLISKKLWKLKGIFYPWIFKAGCVLKPYTYSLLRTRITSCCIKSSKVWGAGMKNGDLAYTKYCKGGKEHWNEGFKENDPGLGYANRVIFTQEMEGCKSEVSSYSKWSLLSCPVNRLP